MFQPGQLKPNLPMASPVLEQYAADEDALKVAEICKDFTVVCYGRQDNARTRCYLNATWHSPPELHAATHRKYPSPRHRKIPSIG